MDVDSVMILLIKIMAWGLAATICSFASNGILYLLNEIKNNIKTIKENTGRKSEEITWAFINASCLFCLLLFIIFVGVAAIILSIEPWE